MRMEPSTHAHGSNSTAGDVSRNRLERKTTDSPTPCDAGLPVAIKKQPQGPPPASPLGGGLGGSKFFIVHFSLFPLLYQFFLAATDDNAAREVAV